MKETALALFALLLGIIPASEAAAQSDPSFKHGSIPSSVRSQQLRALAELELCIPSGVVESVQPLRGYALADKLDEISRAPQAVEFFIRCAEVVLDSALMELAKSLSTPELQASVDPSLAAKIDRLALLTEELFSAVSSTLLRSSEDEREAAWTELSDGFGQVIEVLDDRSRPVAERRLLRHSLRGISAMFCLAGRPSEVDLQAALLDHVIVGYESTLRLLAESTDESQRARIVGLGLEPVDREALNQRAKDLQAAREALEAAEMEVPEFRLPPDPAFSDKSQD